MKRSHRLLPGLCKRLLGAWIQRTASPRIWIPAG
nr:MAG TPA: hypothetical protein [Caudoviricetes sp.]